MSTETYPEIGTIDIPSKPAPVDGTLVGATNDGILDGLIAITDTTMPDQATLITEPGALNTDLDAFAARNPVFAYDFDNIPTPGGMVFTNPGVVPTLSETPGRISGLGPRLGNATLEVMKDLLDLSKAEIERLRQKRII